MAQRNPSSRGRGLVPAVTLALAVLLHSSWCRASLETEMKNMFDGMVNVTASGYHEGMGRGVVAGPSVAIRNRRVRANLIDFTPPSINAGCGGIDMFLGSLSFIDAEQFVNMMQAVASNAAGYAFKLALGVMCPTCDQAITSLQKMMQKINDMAGDSCKLAKGLVDFAADKIDPGGAFAEAMRQGPISTVASHVGDTADAFTSFLNEFEKGSSMEEMSEGDIIKMMGNVAWKAMSREPAVLSFDGSDLRETLMSVTGTIVGTRGTGDSPKIRPYPSRLGVKELLDGKPPNAAAAVKRYTCGGTECTNVGEEDYDSKGLERFVNETLLGQDLAAAATTGANQSFVAKLLMDAGDLTPNEKGLIALAPYHMARLRNMAVCAGGQRSMGGATEYAKKAARLIAIEVVQTYLKDVVQAVHRQTHGLEAKFNDEESEEYTMINTLVPKFQADLKEVQVQINREAEALQADLAPTLETMYKSAVANCDLKPVHLIDPAPGK